MSSEVGVAVISCVKCSISVVRDEDTAVQGDPISAVQEKPKLDCYLYALFFSEEKGLKHFCRVNDFFQV